MMSEMESKGKRKRIGKRKPKINYKYVALSLFVLCLVLALSLLAFIGITLAKNYEIDESLLDMRQTSKIFDREGNQVDQLYFENREYVPIEEIPDLVRSAFIAVEDQRFYEHNGIDIRGIARAFVRNLMAGGTVEGGSTITQQLAKNVFLSHERTYMRKLQEALIAINLERRYTKDEILEMYLNYIYLGAGAHGIKAAAKTYFGKDDLNDLTIGEVALLAALPKAPNHYNPLEEENRERSEQRRQLVLQIMQEQGIITEEERKLAAETELELNPQRSTKNAALNTFVDMVLEEAKELYGLTIDDIYTGGYEIYTTLDVRAQEIMHEAFRADGRFADQLFPPNGPEQIVQGSMVILDHHTGAILAVTGGRDYQPRGLNRAVRDARSPGSAMKPIAVYAPALEEGWNPYSIVRDEQRNYNGYTPRNYTGRYYGPVTMMYALEQSLNAGAVWLLNEIGLSKGLQAAEDFGIKTDPSVNLAVALGGGVQTSPLSMARAYSAFANHGVIMEPYTIEKIVDQRGDTVAVHQPQHKRVISDQTAWYMTEMLVNVVKNGTGRNAQFTHPVAGKTGTHQYDKAEGNQDAWFVGYTPYFTAAVWMGFDRTDERHTINTTGGGLPAQLYKHVMSQVLANYPVKQFERPPGVEELKPPVRLQQITDLKAFLRLTGEFTFAVDLEFTQQEDKRVAYNIYRINEATGSRSLVATIGKGESWSDYNVQLNERYSYEVAPVNTETGEEGPVSNRATVVISPEYPFFRRPEDMDEEEFLNWLREMFGGDAEEQEEEVEEVEGVEEEEQEEQEEKREERREGDRQKGEERRGEKKPEKGNDKREDGGDQGSPDGSDDGGDGGQGNGENNGDNSNSGEEGNIPIVVPRL
ncbi:penicillin-binding protein 1A [Caldalkalibacillus thermarum TA2.A1]|uniref:Penicillin-binding protein 1A n=1 Tax=Caldalkalibacillus thermarum (strain TA2.A1) TaxID=986075 RepID=A0A8X8L8V0_CALTT|nr:penicillin-binding protein 1A [Caldalkalibacillus thermarum]QZT32538.1 penicillin-binding protein 1A [Caldalkalibacillus thermarum TA2.A1]